MSKWPHVQYTDLLQRLFPLALFWQTQCNIGKKEDKLEFFMRQNYIAAVHASRAGLSDLVGPSTIAYFDLTLAFETVPFVHTLFFLHCKYFHYHKYNFSLCSNFQCTLLVRDGDISWTMNSRGHSFSKWANSSGHFLRVNSLGHFWWILMDIFCPREFFSLGEFSWTFFGWILVDIFGEFLWTLLSSNNLT